MLKFIIFLLRLLLKYWLHGKWLLFIYLLFICFSICLSISLSLIYLSICLSKQSQEKQTAQHTMQRMEMITLVFCSGEVACYYIKPILLEL